MAGKVAGRIGLPGVGAGIGLIFLHLQGSKVCGVACRPHRSGTFALEAAYE